MESCCYLYRCITSSDSWQKKKKCLPVEVPAPPEKHLYLTVYIQYCLTTSYKGHVGARLPLVAWLKKDACRFLTNWQLYPKLSLCPNSEKVPSACKWCAAAQWAPCFLLPSINFHGIFQTSPTKKPVFSSAWYRKDGYRMWGIPWDWGLGFLPHPAPDSLWVSSQVPPLLCSSIPHL